MANKCLKIKNLDNLQELSTEGVSSIEGGLSLVQESDLRIAPVEALPQEKPHPVTFYPTKPFYPTRPLPEPIKPYYPLPYYPCSPYPIKEGKLPWCAVIL